MAQQDVIESNHLHNLKILCFDSWSQSTNEGEMEDQKIKWQWLWWRKRNPEKLPME